MSRPQLLIVGGVLLIAAAVAFLFWGQPKDEGPLVTGDELEAPDRVDPEVGFRVQLYFPGAGGWLVVEDGFVAVVDPPSIVAALLAGPTGEGLFAPFPEGTSAGDVFLSADGVAYVDLVSTRAEPPHSGSRAEMLSIYSIVNSILENVRGIEGVVLLWNGQQRPTFAGHIDTGRPLRANASIVAR